MNVYTICSYSNINQAIVLHESIKKNTSDIFTFFCFLIDEIPTELNIEDNSFKLVQIAELKKSVAEFEKLNSMYNPFELCCALKPFCGEYLLKISQENDLIIYLDSDILFYSDIKTVVEEIGTYDILLTPHFTSEPPDYNKISELDINNTGMYNGGFLAFIKNANTYEFIKWWKEKTKKFCFTDFEKGMFVDQIWLNFVPLYFKNVLISNHKGLNVAYWNFHERNLSLTSYNSWKVNNEVPLIFIHYSGFRLYRRDLISIHQTRYNFKDLPHLKDVFLNYALLLEKNAELHKLVIPVRTLKQRIKSKFITVLRKPFSKK